MNKLYPAFLKTEGKKVLVVGGGSVAEQKVKGLLDCGARVTVVAPSVTRWIDGLYAEGRITLERREYRTGDADGFFVVIGATDNPQVQEQVFAEASRFRIPVNVADKPELCSFYLGSVFMDGDLKVAVSTNGKSPTIGKIVRDRIAAEFSYGYSGIIDRIGRIRPDIQNTFPDYESRKNVHERYAKSELARIGMNAENGTRNVENGKRNTGNGERRPGAGERDKKSEARSRNPEVPLTGSRHTDILDGTRGKKAEPNSAGKVYLVGAGPGDPELITVKGLKILRSAEVVLYDALVSDEIICEVSETAEKIYVGKRAGAHCMRQDEINRILVDEASQGKKVVRLKGGDPFVFGRGGEEAGALREAGMEVVVIPGITAGIGVPTSLGLPITSRGESSSVLFLTGHEDASKEVGQIDWESVRHVDTVVVYMGTRKLRSIAEKLIEHGVPAMKPVAVIFGGTLPGEKVVTGTLDSICDQVDGMHDGLPGLIVVGETVSSLDGHVTEEAAGLAKRSMVSTYPEQERTIKVERIRL